jgi:Protein of unknown function (DUF938)
MPGDGGPAVDPRRHAPATLRNREAILAVLREELSQTGTVLEIASGSGEHIVHFAAALPGLTWQPSDPDPSGLASITAYVTDSGLANITESLAIDASAANWPVADADAILCINMIHISPWAATEGLFAGAARLLPPGAPLIAYGPYFEADVPTAESNAAFDQSLRERDSAWGLRDLAVVDALAAAHGFARTRRVSMPANNLLLVWRRPD